MQSKKPSLPSSVFQSSFEEPVGLLNRAALRRGPLVGVDPEVLEVLETLDDDYAVEEVVRGDELREEFEEEDEEGGGNEEGEDEGEDEEGEDGDEDEEGADLDDILADIVDGERREVDVQEETEEEYCISDDGRFGLSDDDEDEVATKFTQYSMSSSVVPRTEQMATLDDRFEKVRKRQFGWIFGKFVSSRAVLRRVRGGEHRRPGHGRDRGLQGG